jgi:hypothetical protein
VGGEIVGDEVDLFAWGLAGRNLVQEVRELLAGMSSGGLAQHFAAAVVQRRVKREGAMAKISKPWDSARTGEIDSTESSLSSA